MALNIKDPETDRLARRLAQETGESITVAIKTAVEERLGRLERAPKARTAREDLMEIAARGRARRLADGSGRSALSEDEILGYGPDGIPR